ncbi:MAG: alpha-hydroxy acid oxidase, partial [Pseudomonadota bacterium]
MARISGRFSHVRNVADMRLRARRALPRPIFDYIDGGAEDEVSRARNRGQFDRFGFVQRSAVDVSAVDTSVDLFGRRYAAPFAIGPTGLAGLAWPKAEMLLARAARAADIPFCLSTVSSVSIEDVATQAGEGHWFQLYIFRDRGLSHDLLGRAKAAGYQVLVITVDCATGGNRERDILNDFTLPLRATHRNVFSTAMRPGWMLRMARNGPPRPENMVEAAAKA